MPSGLTQEDTSQPLVLNLRQLPIDHDNIHVLMLTSETYFSLLLENVLLVVHNNDEKVSWVLFQVL